MNNSKTFGSAVLGAALISVLAGSAMADVSVEYTSTDKAGYQLVQADGTTPIDNTSTYFWYYSSDAVVDVDPSDPFANVGNDQYLGYAQNSIVGTDDGDIRTFSTAPMPSGSGYSYIIAYDVTYNAGLTAGDLVGVAYGVGHTVAANDGGNPGVIAQYWVNDQKLLLVPEPSTIGLMVIGFGMMVGAVRRRTRKA